MIKSTLKIARYCPLVIQGFSNFLGLFQVIMADPVYKVLYIPGGFLAGFLNHQQYGDWFPCVFRCGAPFFKAHDFTEHLTCFVVNDGLIWGKFHDMTTPWKTFKWNPKNGGLEDYFPFQMVIFFVNQPLIFRGVWPIHSKNDGAFIHLTFNFHSKIHKDSTYRNLSPQSDPIIFCKTNRGGFTPRCICIYICLANLW